jgi:NADH-quinone oxidoreductase subunit J
MDILIWILGGLTIGTALMVVLSKHPIRSVLFLVATFFLISAHYVLLNAQFLAIVNMIVYAGAIMVLFLFVLMLLNLNKEVEPVIKRGSQLAALIAGGSLFLVLITALKESLILGQNYRSQDSTIGLVKELGHLLFSKYIVAFEITSILFIAAMVGAILLAKREKQIIE